MNPTKRPPNRVGRWQVLFKYGINKEGNALWLCKCDCGRYRKVVGYNLNNSNSVSCGCIAHMVVWWNKYKNKNL